MDGDRKNDNSDELRKQKRSLLSKIERRETAITFARRDIYEYTLRLSIINAQLAERKAK